MNRAIGVDVGGTFTDLALWDGARGASPCSSCPRCPRDPAQGILDGIRAHHRARGRARRPLAFVAHGTTVATNALLERQGRAHRRWSPLAAFATCSRSPARSGRTSTTCRPTSRRRWCRATCGSRSRERLLADGRGARALAGRRSRSARLPCAARGRRGPRRVLPLQLRRSRPRALVGERVRARLPGLYVSLSSDVSPEFREYERLSHDGAQRLSRPADQPLRRSASGRRCAALGVPAGAVHQPVERRHHLRRRAPPSSRCGRCSPGPSAGVMGAAWVARGARASTPSSPSTWAARRPTSPAWRTARR